MLRSSLDYEEILEEQGKVTAYFDPVFARGPVKYARLLRQMERAGLITWSSEALCECRLFFVPKKSGQLRLIVDARPMNQRCREPPHVALATGAALSRIEVPSHLGLAVAHSDVENYFHRLLLPPSWQKYFALPPISSGLVSVRSIDGVAIPSYQKIYPTMRTVPMGFSWSLFSPRKRTST